MEQASYHGMQPLAEAGAALTSHPASYWLATANPGPVLPPLRGDVQADVVIVGAGFTGLSAAFHLAQAGLDCVVIDSAEPGWGASGRNAGMLAPRYKKGYASIAKRYGNEVTRQLYHIVHDAIDTVEAIVEECRLDCDFRRMGQLTAAHSLQRLQDLQADSDWSRAEVGDHSVSMLDAAAVRNEVGGGDYVGGWLEPRGAGMHPLNYVRGLATALARRGIRLFSRTAAIRLTEEPDGVRLETAEGAIRARRVVIATNAYTETTGFAPQSLHRRIVPVTTSIICTAPLPDDVAKGLLPGKRVVADTKHIMNYYRMMPNNCLLFGGRGDITGRSDDPKVYAMLEKQIVEIFPQVAGAPIAQRWSGKIAITLDDFPHIGRLSSRVVYALGYGGRGVALSNVLGKFLAKLTMGQPIEAVPMASNPFESIPFYAFRVPGMKIVAGWYRHLDRRAAGR
jgi:glycine/D-amino acid oxidase-like deaminating enzyme